jgi:4-amino-4-deoxy-L-arabinose transferase-like glycosyltransferase
VAWCVFGGLTLGIAVGAAPVVVAAVVPAVAMALGLAALHRFLLRSDDPVDAKRVLWWTFMAFAGHVLLGLLVRSSSAVIEYLGGDALTYHDLAVELLHHWTSGSPGPSLPNGKEGFYVLLAAIYWLFGPHPVAGVVVNAALGAAIVPLTYDTTRRLFGHRAARYVGPILVLLPGIFIFSSQLLKEAAVLCLFAIIVNAAVRLLETTTFVRSATLALSLALLFTFRGPVGLMTAGSIVVALAFGRTRLLTGLWTGVSAAVMLAVLVLAVGLGHSGYNATVETDLDQVQNVRLDSATSSATGYDVSADVSTVGGVIRYLPKGLMSFALGPYPWQLRGLRRAPLVPDVLIWWALLPSLWRGLRNARSHGGRRILVCVLPALAVSVLVALAVGNFGTIVRERMQVVLLLTPILALGLALRSGAVEEVPPAVASTTTGELALR